MPLKKFWFLLSSSLSQGPIAFIGEGVGMERINEFSFWSVWKGGNAVARFYIYDVVGYWEDGTQA